MTGLFDRKSRIWATLAVIGGVGLFLGLEYYEEPNMSAFDLMLELVEILPIVVASVGVVLLFQFSRRQHENQLSLLRELEVARIQGQRWRAEARSLIDGLGEAIEAQFNRWNLTEAEREVALLLLKGLSLKEIAAIRTTGEQTVRAQTRSLYSKAGLTGRAALSAFFLEDLLVPIREVEKERH
ncbi:MAG TPA: LuxR C-terminal-related transcriptional regulator [Burkholderiales bacterium]|nr:LuxR C-terminal-related transcriptional regulator [Burkholderiales bacterium]